jgi:lipoic acid synthetase
VAEAAARLGLRYVVLTSVNRDDLPDGGAAHFAATVREIRRVRPRTPVRVEVLTPDFEGDREAVATVLDARPEVFNHNIETVPRLFPRLRPQGRYPRSLDVLGVAARSGVATKSGLMVGLGETDQEVEGVLADLRGVGVDIVTLGQYLRPTRTHEPVHRYVPPEGFEAYARRARELGFPTVHSGVFVRSSYGAEEVYATGGRP